MSGNAEAEEVSLPVKLYIYDLTQGMAKGAIPCPYRLRFRPTQEKQ